MARGVLCVNLGVVLVAGDILAASLWCSKNSMRLAIKYFIISKKIKKLTIVKLYRGSRLSANPLSTIPGIV